MNNEITIGMLADDELEQVASLFSACWRRTYPGIVPDEYLAWLTPATAKQMWEDFLKEPGHFILVARAGSAGNPKVVGMAAAQTYYHLPGAGYLAGLHIDADFRGRRIGKRLIGAVARQLAEQGVDQLALAVIEDNDAALRVYKHLGARVVDFRETDDGFVCNEYTLLWDDTTKLIDF